MRHKFWAVELTESGKNVFMADRRRPKHYRKICVFHIKIQWRYCIPVTFQIEYEYKEKKLFIICFPFRFVVSISYFSSGSLWKSGNHFEWYSKIFAIPTLPEMTFRWMLFNRITHSWPMVIGRGGGRREEGGLKQTNVSPIIYFEKEITLLCDCAWTVDAATKVII